MLQRSMILTFATLVIVCGLVPTSAHANSCRDWNRMSESRRWDAIYQMIDDAVAGQRGRQYHVNRDAIGRCLEAHAKDMYWDFTDRCGDARTASMSAIRARFKQYIWTCVN